MSNLARSPESYAAWQRIKRNQELLPHEQPWVALENGSQEMDILAAGTSYISNWSRRNDPLIHSRPSRHAGIPDPGQA